MARLTGDVLTPTIQLSFNPNDRVDASSLPVYTKPSPPAWYRGPRAKIPDRIETLGDWVKYLPGRSFNPNKRIWSVTGPGPNIRSVLDSLGFYLETPQGFDGDLERFYTPLVIPDEDEWVSWVFPRFMDPVHIERILPAYNVWNEKKRAYLVRTPDLARAPMLPVASGLRQRADQLRSWRPSNWSEQQARASCVNALANTFTDVPGQVPPPDLGEFTLMGYQESGVKALTSGRRLLCDEPGLGKTIQAIGAHKAIGTKRLAVAVPPLLISNWEKEIHRAWPEINVVCVMAGKKEPDFPTEGAVVVADSMLAARPTLLSRLIAWTPDGLIDDESHRNRNLESKRSLAVTKLAHHIDGLRLPVTGTPVITTPKDAIPQLDIAGVLEPVFGGASKFIETFCRWDRYKGWVTRQSTLPQFKQIMDDLVWVRRMKREVLKDLPPMMPFETMLVDVNLKEFKNSHSQVLKKIDAWLEGLGHIPAYSEILDWARGQGALVSLMRKGAGLSKIDAAIEVIQDRVGSGPGPDGLWDDPLIIWTHHQEVTESLINASKKLGVPVASIWGKTKNSDYARIVEDFQSGKTAVLIGSITAAGVGITLTRANQAIFVEPDWTPGIVGQAVDRIERIGQTRAMRVTTLIAPGTLDHRIHARLAETSQMLAVATGDTRELAAREEDLERSSTAEIVAEMVMARLTEQGLAPQQ